MIHRRLSKTACLVASIACIALGCSGEGADEDFTEDTLEFSGVEAEGPIEAAVEEETAAQAGGGETVIGG